MNPQDVPTGANEPLEQQIGMPPNIECPDDVLAVVVATTTYVLSAERAEGTSDAALSRTWVDGRCAQFDVQVPD